MNKFSNFSLNLFFLLLGFFLGNLLPGTSIEFPFPSFSPDISSPTKQKYFFTDPLGAAPSWLPALALGSSESFPTKLEFSQIKAFGVSYFPISQLVNLFPGPGFLGLLVLTTAEYINWWRSQASKRQRKIGLRTGTKFQNSRVLGISFLQNQIEGSESKRGKFHWLKPTGLTKIPQISQLSAYLNSMKIGFLFGIFVDAFKVGS